MTRIIIQNQILRNVANQLTRVEKLVENRKISPNSETRDIKIHKEKIQKPLFNPFVKIKENEKINLDTVKMKSLKK